MANLCLAVPCKQTSSNVAHWLSTSLGAPAVHWVRVATRRGTISHHWTHSSSSAAVAHINGTFEHRPLQTSHLSGVFSSRIHTADTLRSEDEKNQTLRAQLCHVLPFASRAGPAPHVDRDCQVLGNCRPAPGAAPTSISCLAGRLHRKSPCQNRQKYRSSHALAVGTLPVPTRRNGCGP